MVIKKALVPIIIFLFGVGFGYSYFVTSQNHKSLVQIEKNTPKAFIGEVYDKIKENYWDNISDAQLLDLFKLAIDQSGGQITTAKFEDKNKLLALVADKAAGMKDETRNKFVSSVVGFVLASLNPPGRSGLFTQKLEEQLKNTVANINPEKDLYKDLGLAKGASEAAITEAYEKQAETLAGDSSAQAQDKLKQMAYAKDTLSQKDKKERYDQTGVEPTIFTKILRTNILYLQFKKFSPTSLDEFQKAFENYKDNGQLNALILDLRGNVGGAIDATAYFLGFFLGKNQYAFDFYHKGEYLPFKTPTDKLPSITKYKQIVVLTDQNTQSSAEMMAASMKKYHIGVVVGVPTKGWGTVERTFALDNQIDSKEKYSLFLVHSITLRDDNQPIEGRGVEPDININSSSWDSNFFTYYRNPELTEAVKLILNNPK